MVKEKKAAAKVSIKSLIEKMQLTLDEIMADAEKFEDKGVNAAGTRVRTGLQEIKKQAQATRVAVQEAKKKK